MASSAGDISRENLKLHGIIYDEKVYTCDDGDNSTSSRLTSSLPDNVRALRDGLLEFSRLIPDDSKDVFDDEYVQYGSEIPEKDCLQPSPAAYFSQKYGWRGLIGQVNTIGEIEDCGDIAERARNRTKTKEAEPNWTYFLRNSIFREFDEENRSRTRIDILFDRWSLHEDFQWNEFPSWQKRIYGITRRTVPKPDLTYGFPIISERGEGFSRDEYVQSFSLNILGELHSRGVHSAVTTGLRKWTRDKGGKKPKGHDLLCYPWAIVEVKHCQVSEAGIEKCYCQAANASAAALSLQEQLLYEAFGHVPGTLSPLIAFTCIGPRIKVWLTYRLQESNRQVTKMSCILSTSVELTWGVMALRRIEQNMHFWSSRILKPKVFAAINRVREKLHHDEPLTMRTLEDHPRLVILTPPTTPLARNKQKNFHRSSSVQSRQANKPNAPDYRSPNDPIAATSNDRILNSNNESEHTVSEGSDTESDDRYTTSKRNEIECDWRYSISIRNKTEGNRRHTTSETNDTESYEREYTTPEESKTESEESEESEESDDEYDSNPRDGPRKRNRASNCSYQELKDKGRFSPLISLSCSMFARLVSINDWFEDLPVSTKVNVVCKLLDPSNGRLLVSNLTRANKRRRNRLLDILNFELEQRGLDGTTLTKKDLGDKKKQHVINGCICDLSFHQPQALRTCFRYCLYLHSDKGHSIYDILADDLDATLSVKERKEMEKEAFESLSKRDRETLLQR